MTIIYHTEQAHFPSIHPELYTFVTIVIAALFAIWLGVVAMPTQPKQTSESTDTWEVTWGTRDALLLDDPEMAAALEAHRLREEEARGCGL